MPIVPVQSAQIDESFLAVKLATYARIVGLRECLLYGVNDGNASSQCDPIWSLEQRLMLVRYLLEAQSEIENVTGFHLLPTYDADEQRPYRFPLVVKWNQVIEVGVQTFTDISLGEAIDYTVEPAVVGPFPTTVTDENEIVVYHPGTDAMIVPSSITIAGGQVTIKIPRCRLVNSASQENPSTGWDYNDVPPSASSPFEDAVDVKRVWMDTSQGATLVHPHRSSDEWCTSCSTYCEEFTHTACAYVRVAKTGVIDLLRSSFLNDEWVAPSCCYVRAKYARVSYLSGMNPTTAQAEDSVIRLAHCKMPSEPCGCETANQVWKRDRLVPDVMTTTQATNPFGMGNGAWAAWKWANSMKVWRSGVL